MTERVRSRVQDKKSSFCRVAGRVTDWDFLKMSRLVLVHYSVVPYHIAVHPSWCCVLCPDWLYTIVVFCTKCIQLAKSTLIYD